jgi:hypothetical protein
VSEAQHAPFPEPLTNAKSIFLINDSGDAKAYDAFYSEMTKWKHFSITQKKEEADVIAVLTTNGAYVLTMGNATASSGHTTNAYGSAFSIPVNYLGLKVFDGHSGDVLWTDSEQKWMGAGHAPSILIKRLKERFPEKER